MENTNKNINFSQMVIVAHLGTVASGIGKGYRIDEERMKVPPNDRAKVIAYDAYNVVSSWDMPLVERHLRNTHLASSEQIRASIPEIEDRRKLYKLGELNMIDEHWIENPGASQQLRGVSGIIRHGTAMYACVSNDIAAKLNVYMRDIHAYETQRLRLTERSDIERMLPHVQMYVIVHTAGGSGNGAYRSFTQDVNHAAKKLCMHVHIMPIFLLPGNIDSGDMDASCRNVYWAMTSFNAHFDGGLTILNRHKGDQYMFCDAPIFVSNVNSRGEMRSFTSLLWMISRLLYFVCHTGFGPRFHQDVLNVQEQDSSDRLGRRRKAVTIGMAVFNLNKVKIKMYAAYSQAAEFIKRLLVSAPSPESSAKAKHIIDTLNLEESHTANNATQRIYNASSSNIGDVRTRASGVFKARVGSCRLFERSKRLYGASHYVRDTEIPKHLDAAIQHEGANMLDYAHTVIKLAVSEELTHLTPPANIHQTLEHCLTSVNRFDKYNTTELGHAQDVGKGLDAKLARLDDSYRWLSGLSRFWRWIFILRTLQFNKSYPIYARQAMANDLHIIARRTLQSVVYPQIRQLLLENLEYVNRITTNIASFGNILDQEVIRLERLPDEFYAPCGPELANPAFMQKTLEDIYSREGGKNKVIQKLSEAFATKFITGLDIFALTDNSSTEAFLIDRANDIAAPVIDPLRVLDVLRQTFPNPDHLREQFILNLNQSYGSIPLVGQANEPIPGLNYIIGPDQYSCDYAVNLSNTIDNRGGDWRGIVAEDLDCIAFIRVVTRISIPQIIKDCLKWYTPPKDISSRILCGEHPVISFAPSDLDDDRDLDTVIAEGICCGCITLNDNGYVFVRNGKVFTELGSSEADLRKILSGKYMLRMAIYEQFIACLGSQRENLIKMIPSYAKNHASMALGNTIDPVLFEYICNFSKALLPYLR